MMIDTLFLYTNALICTLISLRLLFYQRRRSATYHPGISLLAYALAVASGSVALRIAFSVYAPPVDWAELVLNGTVCVSLFYVRGNLARLVPPFSRSKSRGARRPRPAPRRAPCPPPVAGK